MPAPACVRRLVTWSALLLLGSMAGATPSGTPADTVPRAEARYTLRHEPGTGGAPTTWTVEVEVRGLPADTARLAFELSAWGGAADAVGYLEPLAGDVDGDGPPIRASGPGRFEAVLGDPPHGVVRFRYRITPLPLGSESQRARALLAAAGEDYAFGWSWATLVDVLVDGEPLRGPRSLELTAPKGTPVITGWGGRSTGVQRVSLDPGMGNAPIAFGAPAFAAEASRGRFDVEVFQFGGGRDVTAAIAEVLVVAGPELGRHFGVPARDPCRAFVTDHQPGGMGSHFGLFVGFGADQPAGVEHGEWFRAFVLHEFLHDWIGQRLVEDDAALVWFKEGFTEYLALWTAASLGLVGREGFAGRLQELEDIARSRSALGQVAFGDPSVSWRDGDGPLETLAYTGAPLLALLLDVELREARRPGLPALVRDLLRREHPRGDDGARPRVGGPASGARSDGPPRYGLADLAAWFADAGLADRWQRSVLGTELPPVRETLRRAGYRVETTGDGERLSGDTREADRFFRFRP